MSTLERAIAIAAEAHAGQQDKAGESYILHPLRVMQRVGTNEERIVAVLHDIVEDTSWTLQQLANEGFSSAVVDAVDALTRRENETYEDFVVRAGKNALARPVKLADLADNMELTRIKEPGAKDLERMERYKRAVEVLS